MICAGISLLAALTPARGLERSRALGAGLVALSFFGSTKAHADPSAAPKPSAANEPLEVEVHGQRRLLEHSALAPTTASTVINAEALKRAGASSAELLARVPGVQVSRSGATSDIATASIRGADGKQTPVYLAGIRINDDASGTADLSTVPLWMLERVEVFRGNAPDQADRLGLGGAIFFVPRLPKVSRMGLGLELGSYAERGGFLAYETGTREASALVALRRSSAKNDYLYANDNGQRFSENEQLERRSNADHTTTDGWAIGRYRLDSGVQVTSLLNVFQREQGVTGLAVVPATLARADLDRVLAAVVTHIPCDDSGSCAVELNTSALAANSTLTDPRLELPSLTSVLVENDDLRLAQKASIEWDLDPKVNALFSLEQSLETYQVSRVASADLRAQRSGSQATLALTTQLGALTLQGVVQADCTTLSARTLADTGNSRQSSPTCADFLPAARLGVALRLDPNTELLANVGRYTRTPTLTELFGSSPQVSGNSSLRPEHGPSADLGMRVQQQLKGAFAYSLDAFIFARSVSNMIRYQRSSLASIAPFNVGQARVLGAEVAVAADYMHGLRGETALTLLDPRETTRNQARDPTRNDILPLTSRFVMSSRLEAYLAQGRAPWRLHRAALALSYLHRAARFEDPAGQIVLPAQDFWDVELSAEFLKGTVVTRARMQNALDAKETDLLGQPLPGRSFHVAGEAWF